jgi:hypothetical protein
VGKPEENRSLGRPKHRWVSNIKMGNKPSISVRYWEALE